MLALLHQIWPALLGAVVAAALVLVTISGGFRRPTSPPTDDSDADEPPT